jgi:ketosteroid isomerase-like protein
VWRDTPSGRYIPRRDFRHYCPGVCWYDIRDRESESNFSGGADASLKRTIMECRLSSNEENEMTIASDLLQQHIQTLVDDNARWQTLIADDILWELAYAPSLGHPAQLVGRKEVVRHAAWFVGAVENFRFFNLNVYALLDVQGAVAEVKGEGLIKSTGRMYRQDYVVFLRASDGKIAFLREYFDPVRAAKALDTPILGPQS